MATDPVAFAEARLDEEYASADMLAVQGNRWYVDKDDSSIVRSTFWHVAARCSEEELAAGDRRTGHIARYDPARVHREIEAKRAILRAYKLAIAHGNDSQLDAEILREYRTEIIPPILAVWSDHPDYRAACRPEEV